MKDKKNWDKLHYLEVGAVGASEIGRATDQLGQTLGQSVQHLNK